MGGAPGSVAGAGVRVGGTGQVAHPSRPQASSGPITGAVAPTWAASAGRVATSRLTGWSRQSMACSATAPLDEPPVWYRALIDPTVEPSPDAAEARAPASMGHEDWDISPASSAL